MKNDESSPSMMNLLMGVKALQLANIALLLDIMVECFQPPEGDSNNNSLEVTTKHSSESYLSFCYFTDQKQKFVLLVEISLTCSSVFYAYISPRY